MFRSFILSVAYFQMMKEEGSMGNIQCGRMLTVGKSRRGKKGYHHSDLLIFCGF